jgi:hypothetical protein
MLTSNPASNYDRGPSVLADGYLPFLEEVLIHLFQYE